METDDDLAIGEFGIATRMVQGERPSDGRGCAEPQAEPGATMIYKPRAPLDSRRPARADVALAQEIVTLTVDGKRREVDKRARRDRPLEGLRHPARRPERPRGGTPSCARRARPTG